MEFDALIASLAVGKIDMILSRLSITDERRAKVDFSVPYDHEHSAALVQKRNLATDPAVGPGESRPETPPSPIAADGWSSLDDLARGRIAVFAGVALLLYNGQSIGSSLSTFILIDLAGVGRRVGRPLPVILGKELFHALVVDLDYPGSRIRFLDAASFRYEGPGRKVDLIPAEDGHKSLRLAIEGGEPVVVGLDTGQGGALSVFRHYADERGFLSGRPVSERRGGGVGGATTMKVATLRSVTIAGYELKGVPAAFQATDVRGAFDTKRQEGNLGAGILSRFRVLFDYGRACLWLEPGADLGAPFPKDKSGLVLGWADGALAVEFVAPGSPAAEAGWKEGERVAALDGEPATAEWGRVLTRWSEAKAGTTVRLTLADGTERVLVLKEYY